MQPEEKKIVLEFILNYLNEKSGSSITPQNATKDSLKREIKADEIEDLVIYVTATNEFISLKDEHVNELRIYKNPNYKSIKSVLETNRNIRRSNRVIAGASIATGFFALSAIVVSILSVINSEKLKPELIKLNNTLQMQEQILKRLEPSLINLNRSIQNVADSLPK